MKKVTLKPESKNEHFKSMYHSLAEGILVVTLPEQIIEYINPALEELLGYTSNECIGQQSSLLYPDLQSYLTFDEQLKKYIEQDEKYIQAEQLLKRKDGENFPAAMSISCIERRRTITSYVGNVRDITTHRKTRKSLLEKEERFKLPIEQSFQGIIIAQNNPLRLCYASKQIEDISGYSRVELDNFTSLQLMKLIHPEDRNIFFKNFRDRLSGKKVNPRHEYRIVHKTKGTRWIELWSSQIEYGETPAAQAAFIDITERKLAELALQESESRFRGFFEGAQDGILIADIESKQFIDANPAICAMTGYTVDEFKSLGVLDIHPQEELPYIVEQFIKQSSGEISVAENIPVLRKDDTLFPADISGSQTIIDGRQCRAGVFRDITKRNQTIKALVEAREKHQNLLDNIGDKFVIFSFNGLTGEVLYLSDGIATVFGLSKENLIGNFWESAVDWLPESVAIAADNIGRQIKGSADFLQFEMSFTHPDGDKRVVRVASHPVRNEVTNLISINGILEDFTEQKQIEEQLVKARQEAVKANLTKSEFLTNMSHEIRTPMNAIIGFIDLSLQAELSTEVRKHLDIVKMSSRYLLELINNILDLSKIESSSMVIENIDFNLHDILFNLEEMLREKAAEKGNQLTISRKGEIPDDLIGDPLRLGQVLVNLIGNAIKFTQDGEISLQISRQNNSEEFAQLQFSVQDTGIGIAGEKLDDIFKTFTQADTSIGREFGGTGLGLTIARQLSQLMGGDLEVSSTPGEGSIFSFSLPLGIQAVNEQLPLAMEFKGKKILITDDDHMVLKSLQEVLLYGGFKVEISELPSITMKMMREAANQNEPYDLVLLDFMMPEQDGIATAKEIRNDPLLAHTPIIMLTGCGTDLENQRAKGVSINAFLRKPISLEILFKNIQIVLQQHESRLSKIAPQQQTTSSEMLTGCKILLVEDDPFNQLLARKVLTNAGLRVESANNGKEALAQLDSTFDAVLMDVQMPELDGLAATSLIRRCETCEHPQSREDQELISKLSLKIYGGHIPVIAMTANAMAGDREKCLKAGMDDYITKPFKKDAVLQALAQVTNGCNFTNS